MSEENKSFLKWLAASPSLYLWVFAGLQFVVFSVLSLALSSGQDYLIAARVTVIQQARSKRGAVHFAYDGHVIHHSVKSNFDLRPFRHWGCYWLRVAPANNGAPVLVSVVGEAPGQACAD
jgi:hypothetical protein